MPFIISRVNIPINKEQEIELKSRLGKAIELVPGKSEEYLLVGFEDNYHLYLRGDNSKPIAYIVISIFGNNNHSGYDKLTSKISSIFGEVLGIEPNNVYIKYEDIVGWGFGSINFDRNRYI